MVFALAGACAAAWSQAAPVSPVKAHVKALAVAADERYHVELKLDDPKTKTRIPYAKVSFEATNATTGKTATLSLPPMWGSSGLHYSANSALFGDGAYDATVKVDERQTDRGIGTRSLVAHGTTGT